MNQVIRVADAREVLALVPFQLGYTPRESVVFVALRGERQRLGVMARADGVDLARSDGHGLLESIADFLERDGAQRAIVILYGDDDSESPGRWFEPVLEKIDRTLAHRMSTTLWSVHGGSLRVAPDLESHGGTRDWGAPMEIGDLSTTQVSATMVLKGNVVAKDRAELARLPRMSPELEQRLWRASDRYRRIFKPITAASSPQGKKWLERSEELWGAALDAAVARSLSGIAGRPELPPLTWARLGVSLNNTTLRDRVLARIVRISLSGDCEVSSVSSPGDDTDVSMGELFATTIPRAPDATILRALTDVVAYATSANRRKHRTDGCAILGLLAWWEGSGARAREYCEAALRIDRSHRLADLVLQALDVGMPPGWVKSRRKLPSGVLRE